MKSFSLCSLTGKMECPGLVSKGDLNQFHCHCPVHFQNYRLSVVGGLCGVLLWQNLIGGGGNRWATTSSNAWATSFNSSSKARNRTMEEKGGKPLNSFPFHLFCCFCISLALFFYFP